MLGTFLIFPAFIGFFIFMITYILVCKPEGYINYTGCIITVIVLILLEFFMFFFFPKMYFKQYNNRIKSYEETGQIKFADIDFPTAEPLFRDHIRVGSRFVFCKQNGIFLPIGDLKRIYREKIVYTGARSGTEDTVSGIEIDHTIELCRISSINLNDWDRFVMKLSSINPDITVDTQIYKRTVHVESSR